MVSCWSSDSSASGQAAWGERLAVAELVPQLLGDVRRERCEQERERLGGRARERVAALRDVAREHHQLRDRGVEAHAVEVLRDAVDGLGDEPLLVLAAVAVAQRLKVAVVVDDEAPGPVEEAAHAADAVGRPGCVLVERPDEHLVEAHRVRAELVDHVVGVHDVAAALRHLLDDLLEHEAVDRRVMRRAVGALAHLVERNPAALHLVATVARDEALAVRLHLFVGIDVRLCGGVVRQVVVEVAIAVAEDHSLVDQLVKGLLRVHDADVVEHLVPEARVEQVEDRVLNAAHVDVDRHPSTRSDSSAIQQSVLGIVRDRKKRK